MQRCDLQDWGIEEWIFGWCFVYGPAECVMVFAFWTDHQSLWHNELDIRLEGISDDLVAPWFFLSEGWMIKQSPFAIRHRNGTRTRVLNTRSHCQKPRIERKTHRPMVPLTADSGSSGFSFSGGGYRHTTSHFQFHSLITSLIIKTKNAIPQPCLRKPMQNSGTAVTKGRQGSPSLPAL